MDILRINMIPSHRMKQSKSVSSWQRHSETLCGARKADAGALRVNKDGLAVTACLRWEDHYDEDFLQSWPPQGTTEFHSLYIPPSQTAR
ncbi:F-box only protein 34 isoform X2 [Emydura macquarii macquarii]|uniref:F-box only protein 34 isoform X2 n=1 Tax=Emydura macquarii macquarii TaxID=1129001 RepID=UPI00352A5537